MKPQKGMNPEGFHCNKRSRPPMSMRVCNTACEYPSVADTHRSPSAYSRSVSTISQCATLSCQTCTKMRHGVSTFLDAPNYPVVSVGALGTEISIKPETKTRAPSKNGKREPTPSSRDLFRNTFVHEVMKV